MDPKIVEVLVKGHLEDNHLLPDMRVPWRIKNSKLGGRGLFATRKIAQGELIFVDTPLVIGPRASKKSPPLCVVCFKTNCPLFPCARGCGLPVCSDKCERTLKHARLECEYLRACVPTCGSDWSPELLRALVAVRALALNPEQRSLLAGLQSHQGQYHGQELQLLEANIKNPLKEEDKNFMKLVCEVFDANSFETVVTDGRSSLSLRALYPMGALQNHACVPKTRHHFDAKQRYYVYAAVPIAPGEELTITYTDIFWDTTLRRQYLQLTKHFWCGCERCADATEFGSYVGGLLCATVNCRGNLLPHHPLNPTSEWLCTACVARLKSDQIASIRSGLAAIVEESIEKSPRHLLRFFRKEFTKLVPPNNYLALDLKFRIVSYFGRTDDLPWQELTDDELAKKVEYCKDILSVLDVLGYGDCKVRGLVLYEQYCANIEIFKRLKKGGDKKDRFEKIGLKENEALLQKAAPILQGDVAAVHFAQEQAEQ